MSEMAGKLFSWFNNRLPIVNTFERHLSKHPVPSKVNFWYLFGALAAVTLIIQIVTGIWLIMPYSNTEEQAFSSIEYIMRDVDYGWVIRYMHTTGASLFFAVVYLHMFRGLLYGSYQKPKELVWIFGCTIYLAMMAEGFLGYVLPYGQMSYWGAQVIISLFGAIPYVGESLELWVRGDYYISGITVSRFFALHVVALPLILIALVFLHLVALHEVGAGNPEGGFAIEDSDYVNSASESYVSMNWVANNGVTATDSSGNMDCELQANPTAGFSIAKFTVNGTGVRTWAHGLGKTPEFGHLWTYNTTTYGTFYHHKMSATPAQNYMFISTSGGISSFTNGWGTAGPSSSLWSGTEGQVFSNGIPYMFYSWTGIEGYSRFDTYVGNGSTDGTFVYTGFKPRTIWIKSTSAVSNYVFDTVRNPNNPNGKRLIYDGTYVEDAGSTEALLIFSNGFKLTNTSAGTNGNGYKYVYGAWAEHPFFGADGKSIATAYG